jgi:hypothetical protein
MAGKQKPPTEQDFAAVVVSHDKGRAHTEASRKLTEAVGAVIETGKAATITVKLKVSPVKDMPTAVKIDTNVLASIPKEQSRSIWFVDDESILHRNDPRQMDMFGNNDDKVVRHRSETPTPNTEESK